MQDPTRSDMVVVRVRIAHHSSRSFEILVWTIPTLPKVGTTHVPTGVTEI